MKAFDDPGENRSPGLASSFSLTEKSAPRKRSRDEHKQTGILTPNLEPRSRLPGPKTSGNWEFVVRYSGATVPDSNGVS